MCSLSKEQSILSRETTKNGFLELSPFFDLDFCILYQAPHSRALASECGALVNISLLTCLSASILKGNLLKMEYHRHSTVSGKVLVLFNLKPGNTRVGNITIILFKTAQNVVRTKPDG